MREKFAQIQLENKKKRKKSEPNSFVKFEMIGQRDGEKNWPEIIYL